MISLSRIVFACVLLFSKPFSTLFFVMFSLCAVSDVLDGLFARALHAQSDRGGRLDTFVDAVTLIFTVWALSSAVVFPIFVWITVGVIAAVKLCAAAITYCKTKNFTIPHSVLNILAGLTLAICVYLLAFFDVYEVCLAGCIVTAAAALSDLIKSIFVRGAV